MRGSTVRKGFSSAAALLPPLALIGLLLGAVALEGPDRPTGSAAGGDMRYGRAMLDAEYAEAGVPRTATVRAPKLGAEEAPLPAAAAGADARRCPSEPSVPVLRSS